VVPIRSVDQLLELTDAILNRHAALGASSPLKGQLDTAPITDLLNRARIARNEAVAANATKQALYEKASTIIGSGKGQTAQTPDTLRWHIGQACNFLKFRYKGNEEQASLWGFQVTVGSTQGRRDVKFHLPGASSPNLMQLAESIIAKHLQDGAGSILTPPLVDMVVFQTACAEAAQLRTEAQSDEQVAQASNELARNLCGFGAGQTSLTPDTLYNYVVRVRDLLLTVYSGNEEQLELWGYAVRVR
jgi:hypothetical protein